MQPKNSVSRTSGSAVENSVMPMQYKEKMAMIAVTMILGTPSQMRVADSRSYLRITSSISAAISSPATAAAVSTAGACSTFFLNKLKGKPSFS